MALSRAGKSGGYPSTSSRRFVVEARTRVWGQAVTNCTVESMPRGETATRVPLRDDAKVQKFFCFGKFLSLSGFGSTYTTESGQRQKLTGTETSTEAVP